MSGGAGAATLPFLTQSDLARLRGLAQRREVPDGEVLIEEGKVHRKLLIVHRGKVRIQRAKGERALVYGILGEGEVIGEMSFLERTPASADVVAHGPLTVDVLEDEVLTRLLQEDPALGQRFFRSVAVAVSRRLRVANRRLQEAGQRDPAEKRSPAPRDGLPEGLRQELRTFRRRLAQIEAETETGERSGEEAVVEVRALADGLLNSLTAQARLMGPVAIRAAFRELFPELMRSATISACYSRPGGYPADVESLAMVHEKTPMGDGAPGRWVDAWFLGRPLSRGIRDGARLLARLVSGVERRTPGGHLLLVGAPSSRDVVHAAFHTRPDDRPAPRLTILDPDDWALARAASAVEVTGMSSSVTLLHDHFDSLVAGELRIALEPQQLIASLRLAEFSSDDALVQALTWMHGALAPGGVALIANFLDAHPDRLLVDHLLDWPVHFRSRSELEELLRRTPFAPSKVQLDTDRMGARVFAILQR